MLELNCSRLLLLTANLDVGLAFLEQLGSYPAIRDTEIVETSRLDDVVDGNFGFIKIDVEGHELSVLHGAASIHKPMSASIAKSSVQDRHNPGGPAKLFKYNARAIDLRRLASVFNRCGIMRCTN